MIGIPENFLYEEHFWQFSIRHFLQAAIVLYEKYPQAKTYVKYFYELWTARAPASGFNSDGNWHNGTCYFSANEMCIRDRISYMPYSKPIVITYLCAETGTYQFHPPWRKRRIVTKHNIRHHPGQTGKYVVCYLRRTQ